MLPAGQTVQSCCDVRPEVLPYEPALQSVGDSAPSVQYPPTSHIAHELRPVLS